MNSHEMLNLLFTRIRFYSYPYSYFLNKFLYYCNFVGYIEELLEILERFITMFLNIILQEARVIRSFKSNKQLKTK